MATLEDAILWDVCANPDADLPRLAYADFLEERGQPGDDERAEFIRAQCELASGQDPVLYLCRAPLPLKATPGWTTTSELFRQVVITRWERGFVHALGCGAPFWLRHGAEVVTRQPVLDVTLRLMQPLHWGQRAAWRMASAATEDLRGPYVPVWLWKHLCDFPLFVCYANEESALRALSQACVRYARTEAGLPPYPFVVVPHST